MVYLILNGIEITTKLQLEELIVNLPEESKIALITLFELESQKKLQE